MPAHAQAAVKARRSKKEKGKRKGTEQGDKSVFGPSGDGATGRMEGESLSSSRDGPDKTPRWRGAMHESRGRTTATRAPL